VLFRSGDGIAIALASAEQAVIAHRAGRPFEPAFARHATRPIQIASTLRHLAEHPASAAPLHRLLGIWPGLIGMAACATRIG
jgi:hypothetical protein